MYSVPLFTIGSPYEALKANLVLRPLNHIQKLHLHHELIGLPGPSTIEQVMEPWRFVCSQLAEFTSLRYLCVTIDASEGLFSHYYKHSTPDDLLFVHKLLEPLEPVAKLHISQIHLITKGWEAPRKCISRQLPGVKVHAESQDTQISQRVRQLLKEPIPSYRRPR